MNKYSQRLQFVSFLEKLATVGVCFAEWQDRIVTHYPDEITEKARRSFARLTLNYSFDEDALKLKRLQLKSEDTELRCQIQAIAANLASEVKEEYRSIRPI